MENVNVSSEDIQSVIATDPTFGLKLRIAALERVIKEKDLLIAALTPEPENGKVTEDAMAKLAD